MTITPMITKTPNITEIASIHAASFPQAWSANELQEMLTVNGTMAFVTDGGFGLIRLIAAEAELLTLAVIPRKRGVGIGTRLMTAMLSWLKVQGAQTLFLEVRESNTAAISLYGKAGFKLIARRKDYYTGADGFSEAALVMRCSMEQ